MKNKLTIEIEVDHETGSVEMMFDGTIQSNPALRVSLISSFIHNLRVSPGEALTAMAYAFDEDYDDGHMSGEDTVIELRLPKNE